MTFIIYFDGLLLSPFERSLDDGLLAWAAYCEEPLILHEGQGKTCTLKLLISVKYTN